jgi:hypothetical protein
VAAIGFFFVGFLFIGFAMASVFMASDFIASVFIGEAALDIEPVAAMGLSSAKALLAKAVVKLRAASAVTVLLRLIWNVLFSWKPASRRRLLRGVAEDGIVSECERA